LGIIQATAHGQDRDQRIADLEQQLKNAKGSVAALQKTIESLSAEVESLRQPVPKSSAEASGTPAGSAASKEAGGTQADAAHDFSERILR
jgi:peptidoglycan hydrolase CwlO-like protein